MISKRLLVPLGLFCLCETRTVQAELRIAPPRVELGEIRAGLPLEQVFELINDGPETVEILEARAGCGCLQPRAEPRFLMPRSRGKLLLKVHTLGQAAGPHAWQASVRFRQAGQEREISVTLAVLLITEVTVQPAFLTLVTSGTMNQIITVSDHRPQPLTITAVHTSSPALKARLLKPPAGHKEQENKIQIEIGPTLEEGRHQEMLTIYTSDHLYSHFRVPVTIVKEQAQSIFALPERVVLEEGATVQMVRLRFKEDKPLGIDKMAAGHPALTCCWAPGPGNQATVKILVDRTRMSGPELESVVRIYLSGPGKKILTIPVHCRR